MQVTFILFSSNTYLLICPGFLSSLSRSLLPLLSGCCACLRPAHFCHAGSCILTYLRTHLIGSLYIGSWSLKSHSMCACILYVLSVCTIYVATGPCECASTSSTWISSQLDTDVRPAHRNRTRMSHVWSCLPVLPASPQSAPLQCTCQPSGSSGVSIQW